MTARFVAISRGVPMWLAALVVVTLVWRVLISGVDALQTGGIIAVHGRTASPLDVSTPDAALRKQLARNPTDTRALLLLAVTLEHAGKRAESRDAIRQALRLAPADQAVLGEAANLFLRTGDAASALAILRRLVDLYPVAAPQVWPVFTQLLVGGGHAEFFTGVARDNPIWWPGFFKHACVKATAMDGVQALVTVRNNAGTATADERRCLITRLQRDNQWPAAYQAWLNSLPAEQRQRIGYIFNGTFELPLSNLGFDWVVPGQQGVNITTEQTDGVRDKRALHASFLNVRYTGPAIQQYLMLVPGKYRFEGRGRPEGFSSWLGMQWGIYCHAGTDGGGEARQLTHSDGLLGSSDWVDFAHEFSVPKDCPVQILRLELASPRRDAKAAGNVAIRLRGGVWFDDMKVKAID